MYRLRRDNVERAIQLRQPDAMYTLSKSIGTNCSGSAGNLTTPPLGSKQLSILPLTRRQYDVDHGRIIEPLAAIDGGVAAVEAKARSAGTMS